MWRNITAGHLTFQELSCTVYSSTTSRNLRPQDYVRKPMLSSIPLGLPLLLLLGPGACTARMMMDGYPVLSASDGPPPSFVTQPQDHFDATNTKTWQQARLRTSIHSPPLEPIRGIQRRLGHAALIRRMSCRTRLPRC